MKKIMVIFTILAVIITYVLVYNYENNYNWIFAKQIAQLKKVPNGDVIEKIDMSDNAHWFFSPLLRRTFTVTVNENMISKEEVEELGFSIMAKIDENFSRTENEKTKKILKPPRYFYLNIMGNHGHNYEFNYQQGYRDLTDTYYWAKNVAPRFSRFNSKIGYIQIEIEEIGTVYNWEDSDGNKVNIIEYHQREVE
jgi:hypothetical protein